MRRWISLGLIAVFLTVSSMPLVPAAEMCARQDGKQQATHALFHSAAQAQSRATSDPVMHLHYGRATGKPAGPCSLECGCGCHNNIDTLPHQLAPHVLSAHLSGGIAPLTAAIALSLSGCMAHIPSISTPPPRKA